MLAIWAGALAPAISQALGSERRVSGVSALDICGSRHVRADHFEHGKAPTVARFEACAYCATHAGSFGLLPVDIQFSLGSLNAAFQPLMAEVEPWAGSVEITALPRAPPSVS